MLGQYAGRQGVHVFVAGEIRVRGVDDARAFLVDEKVRHGSAGTRGHLNVLEYHLPSLLLQGMYGIRARHSIGRRT